MPEVVYPCPGGQGVQDHKRGKNRVQIAVHISLRVVDGEGVRTQRMTGKIQKTVKMVVQGWIEVTLET